MTVTAVVTWDSHGPFYKAVQLERRKLPRAKKHALEVLLVLSPLLGSIELSLELFVVEVKTNNRAYLLCRRISLV